MSQTYWLAINIIRACWIIFFLVWLLTAISTKASVYRENRAHRMRYWLLLVFAYFLLLKGRQLPYPLNIPVFPYTQVTAWTGAILCSLGLVFCIWARVTLGRNWSGTITLKADHELIERGPYRIVRHPIYSGLLAMFVATAIAEGHLGEMIGVVLAFVSFWIKLGDEEKLMLEHFPQQYATYQQRVKRIIPFVL